MRPPRQPYWETEGEHPLPTNPAQPNREPVPADCLLCGWHDTSETIRVRPAWYRDPRYDADGVRLADIVPMPRCLNAEACRVRVQDNGEAWPLLERGEDPARPRTERPQVYNTEPLTDIPWPSRPAQPIEPQPDPPSTEDDERWFSR